MSNHLRESRICNFKRRRLRSALQVSYHCPVLLPPAAPSGPAVTFAVQGNIGEVIVNPYKLAPLTAIIRNGGYELQDVEVRIVPKQNGQEIKYKVSKRQLKNNAGIPIFGLYPDYLNTVEVKYTRLFKWES